MELLHKKLDELKKEALRHNNQYNRTILPLIQALREAVGALEKADSYMDMDVDATNNYLSIGGHASPRMNKGIKISKQVKDALLRVEGIFKGSDEKDG